MPREKNTVILISPETALERIETSNGSSCRIVHYTPKLRELVMKGKLTPLMTEARFQTLLKEINAN